MAWGNSLFEDNAEFGFGLYLAMKHRRAHLAERVETLAAECPELAESCRAWLGSREDAVLSAQAGKALLAACETLSHPLMKEIAASADLLAAKSVWLIGGDGWAFDIGFGGLDHVLASGEKVRALVLNTQVYSNTGGQASKATPAGAAARLMSGGKSGAEKDLGLMAMTYGHVYVAQVAMGANPAQLLKAMREAEAWDGAALIIAYAPCIAHGIDMRDVQEIEKDAVKCGYFPLYRYHPANGLMLDSKAPDRGFSGVPDAAGAVCGIAPERSGEEREPLPNGGRSGAAALEPAGNAEKSENAVKPHLEQTISKGNNCFHVGKRAATDRIHQRERCLTKIAV